MSWTLSDLDDQQDRTVVITGGNSGIGFEAAKALAARHARVIIACRDPDKAAAACEAITAETPNAKVEPVQLDLASLASVSEAASEINKRCQQLDVLINNAGIMGIPRRLTEDGFELQLGTNHFGHFALTGGLFNLLRQTPDARVVNVSSLAHHFGFINFANLQGAVFYDPWAAYGQSKLANLLFTLELQRRCRASGVDVTSVACHPGIAATNLPMAGPRMAGLPLPEDMMRMAATAVAQSAAEGALPTLYAGFEPGLKGGDYIGPNGIGETRGTPGRAQMSLMARNEFVAQQLWRASEQATQVSFNLDD